MKYANIDNKHNQMLIDFFFIIYLLVKLDAHILHRGILNLQIADKY